MGHAASADKRSLALGNLDAIDAGLRSSDLDAVIASSAENVRFAADVSIPTQTLLKSRMAFVVWPQGRQPVMLVAHVEAAHVRSVTWIEDVRTYLEPVEDPVAALSALLRELGLEAGRVGVEVASLPAQAYLRLVAGMPRMRIEAAEPLFAAARMRKTPRERDLMIAAFRLTQQALERTFHSARPGDSEKGLATRLATNMLEAGADEVGFIYMTAGASAGYAHKLPGAYVIRKGDFIKADVGLVLDSYRTNFGRSAFVGSPTQDEAGDWARLCDVHQKVGARCRAGSLGADIFGCAQAMQIAAGFPHNYAHNGHGIGLDLHERPAIRPGENIPFEPGMLVTVETRHREAGKLGMHMEDLVEITDGPPIWHTGPCTASDLVRI